MQVAEYNRLKTKAGKKSASLNQQLERVRDFTTQLHIWVLETVPNCLGICKNN